MLTGVYTDETNANLGLYRDVSDDISYFYSFEIINFKNDEGYLSDSANLFESNVCDDEIQQQEELEQSLCKMQNDNVLKCSRNIKFRFIPMVI